MGVEMKRFIDALIGRSQFSDDADSLKHPDVVRTSLKTKQTPIFPQIGSGFEFTPGVWKAARSAGAVELARCLPDALAHRQEAIRRAVVCRLDGRPEEAQDWTETASFLSKTCNLPPMEDPNGQ